MIRFKRATKLNKVVISLTSLYKINKLIKDCKAVNLDLEAKQAKALLEATCKVLLNTFLQYNKVFLKAKLNKLALY